MKKEMVNHPSHYNRGQIEAIDVIEDWELGFSLGSAIKYISRLGAKDTEVQELEKAKWYIKRVMETTRGSYVGEASSERYIPDNVASDWKLNDNLLEVLENIYFTEFKNAINNLDIEIDIRNKSLRKKGINE